MVARLIKLNRRLDSPASGNATDYIITGKTQGPVDYLVLDLSVLVTENNTGAATDTGLLNALDRIEVSIDASDDKNITDTGSIFYTLFGGALGADNAIWRGSLSAINRQLFRSTTWLKGNGTTTKNQVTAHGLTTRLPLFKNAPVTVSAHYYLAATAQWTNVATNTLAYTTIVCQLFAHQVDNVTDMKVRQQTKIFGTALSESEMVDVPDAPDYWLVGVHADIRPTAGTTNVDRLGGFTVANVNTVEPGWMRITNSDGTVFSWATGCMIKQDMNDRAGPEEMYCTTAVFATNLTNRPTSSYDNEAGQYFMMLPSPIQAKSLKVQVYPDTSGVATDVYRFTFIYSKAGPATTVKTAQQPESTAVGAGGAISAQAVKR